MANPIVTFDGKQYNFQDRTVTENGETRPFSLEGAEADLPSWEEINARHDELVELSAQNEASATCVTNSRTQMRSVTDAILQWNQNASAYLFGPRDGNGVPLYGSFSVATVVPLLQQGETAILAYKACVEKPESLKEEYEWLIARTAQANTLMNLAALMG